MSFGREMWYFGGSDKKYWTTHERVTLSRFRLRCRWRSAVLLTDYSNGEVNLSIECMGASNGGVLAM